MPALPPSLLCRDRVSAPFAAAFRQGHERLQWNIEQHLRALIPAGQTPAAPLTLVADYMAGAILTMLSCWLDNEMPYSPEQLDALFHQLVLPGVIVTLQIPAKP